MGQSYSVTYEYEENGVKYSYDISSDILTESGYNRDGRYESTSYNASKDDSIKDKLSNVKLNGNKKYDKKYDWYKPFRDHTGVVKPFMVWNTVAALLHIVNAIVTLAVDVEPDDVEYPIYQGFSDWTNKTKYCGDKGVGTYSDVFEFTNPTSGMTMVVDPSYVGKKYSLNLAYLIFSFHLLSGVFQLCVGCFFGKSYSRSVQEDGVNMWRFFEYSISASIMLICLLLIQYVQDVYAHIGVGVLTAGTMLFGLVAEWLFSDSFLVEQTGKKVETIVNTSVNNEQGLQLVGVASFVDEVGLRKRSLWSNDTGDRFFKGFQKETVSISKTYLKVRKIGWCAHFSGWVTMAGAYGGVLFNHFYWSVENSDRKAPDFVEPLLWSICALYNIFGFTQLYQMCLKDPCLSSCFDKSSKSKGFLCTSRTKLKQSEGKTPYCCAWDEKAEPSDSGAEINCSCCGKDISLNEGIELFYVLNSLVTKTVLGWVIISQLLIRENIKINQTVECE